MQREWVRPILLLCAGLTVLSTLSALSACAPIAPAGDGAQPDVTAEPSSGVVVTAEPRGSTLMLEITSETGIGSARITLGDTAAIRDLILRLHLAGLEELDFDYPGAAVLASVSSHDLSVREQAQPAGASAPQTITPGSPWWMEIGILRAEAGATPVIPLPDGYFDVSVPRDFLRGGHDSFTVSWVDFYR